MADKIRILACAEYNSSLSGFGKYQRELFSRLLKNARFELAELSSFASVDDNKLSDAKWKCYPVAVNKGDPRFQQYRSNPENTHGFWRFERVCLDFKPHIVLDIRDPWNLLFEGRSPLRPYYHWVISPTVDSYPQQDEWIEAFMGADAVFTYSDFGLNVLREQSNNQIKLQKAIYSGVDLEIYKPLDSNTIRDKYGIPREAMIIGTVMRNQRRKLYPELFEMFRGLLDKYKDDPNVQNAYLYIHTSYPDFGWDIPALLRDYGISNRVLMTYYCIQTKQVYVSHFEGSSTYSSFSHSISGKTPTVADGLTESQLAEVINLFDIYIQYASNEGCGIPMLEAAACAKPIVGINYSSMEDNIRLTEGTPLSYIKRFDPDTMAYRAVPLIDKNIDELYSVVKLSKEELRNKGLIARKAAEEHFNWDINAKVLGDYFESVQTKPDSETWDSPIKKVFYPKIPDNLSNFEYIKWLAKNVAKNPNLAYSYHGLIALDKLNTFFSLNAKKYTREDAYETFKVYGDNIINTENARELRDVLVKDDFIEFANCWNK